MVQPASETECLIPVAAGAHVCPSPQLMELREYYYDTACAFRKTHVVDGNRLKYEGFEALSLSVNS